MKMDMSEEKEVKRRMLLPEGNRPFIIHSCIESTSKSGNPMIVFTLIDKETKSEDKVYAVAVKGKRFLLKQILTACGIPAGQDGIYEFEINDLLNKEVMGEVIHEENEWINRAGETVKTKQHRIVEFSKPEEVAWDEGK